MQRSPRSAFTLVELLVVIAIIGVLVALLLPAVQAARESARRTQCTNNLKQIGVALHNYNDTLRTLPPGLDLVFVGSTGERWQSRLDLVHILPFIEQQPLYDKFDFSSPPEGQIVPGGTALLAATIVKSYVCPSDKNFGLLGGRAIHNYTASSGPTAHIDNPNCSCSSWSSWNTYAIAPYTAAVTDPSNFAGPFHRRAVAVRLGEITDGLSQTIFFGEVRRDCSSHVRGGWVGSNNANGLTSTMIPINTDTCNDAAANGCQRPCNWSTELGFKSLHPSGANFLLGDGAVKFFSQSIDHDNYQAFGGKSDGRTATVP